MVVSAVAVGEVGRDVMGIEDVYAPVPVEVDSGSIPTSGCLNHVQEETY